MEARESNEHIDLMRLIVMQLISAPAPVTKMKGLQLSEINWDLPPPPTPLFLSQPRQFGHVSEGFGRQRISAVSCLCLSTCQPSSLSPTLLSLRLQELSHTKGRWIQVDSGGKCGGTRRSALMCQGAGPSLRINMHHDSRSSFSQ